MTKKEYNAKTLKAILAQERKAPTRLYRNLFEMHSALYARALKDEFPTYAKTFAAYHRIYTALAADYDEMDDQKTAMQYRLAIHRAERQFNRKRGK